MRTIFEIRKLGEPTDYLGINIHRDEETGTITIDQEDKARAIAEEFGVANSRKSLQCLRTRLWDFERGKVMNPQLTSTPIREALELSCSYHNVLDQT
jgi:hypothetical protein